MIAKENIDRFLSGKNIAVAGVSRSGRKFGNSVFNSLKEKGYNVYQVNPSAGIINDVVCYPDLKSIPVELDGVVAVVKPGEAMKLAADAVELNIKNFWLQPGSESEEVLGFCRSKGMNAVNGECILMFGPMAESIHKFHGWIKKITGTYPKYSKNVT